MRQSETQPWDFGLFELGVADLQPFDMDSIPALDDADMASWVLDGEMVGWVGGGSESLGVLHPVPDS
jgi:hypothetical protein